MHGVKSLIKKLTPAFALLWYHRMLAFLGAVFYGFPSRKMIVIGVTGTKGKTSTANFIWSVLQTAGFKTGIITTANIRIGEEERANALHMTMPGRFAIQKLLKEMADAKCLFVVVETTSQGILQYRHKQIAYDIAVFTNLSPEHIESHGSYEKYRDAKAELFKALHNTRSKKLLGAHVQKIILVNGDDKEADFYAGFASEKTIRFGVVKHGDIIARNIEEGEHGIRFVVGNTTFESPILGAFNAYNILPAIAIARHFNIPDTRTQKGVENLKVIPGRMEKIREGNNFHVIVDYAHEQSSMQALLSAARTLVGHTQKIILLFGSEGGGRDKQKRKDMGELAGRFADIAIVSDTDPYDEDPEAILEDIAQTARTFGKKDGETLFLISDRREGIRKALRLAHKGDVVLFACMGAQKTMMRKKNKAIAWDEREIVREEVRELLREQHANEN